MSKGEGIGRHRWAEVFMMSLLLGLLLLVTAHAQEPTRTGSDKERGEALLRESRFTEAEAVFADWVAADSRSPDAHYYLALSRALQGRTSEAREGFKHVLELDARRADACFEIAAGLLTGHDYQQALTWVSKGLRLVPGDPFGLDLAGTVFYLSGAKAAALRYWNRLDRPHLSEIRIVAHGGVGRQLIADEIALAPGDLLSWKEIEKARWRLAQHRYITDVVLEPAPGPTPDDYALDVTVSGRRGIGSPVEFLFNTLADVGFRTWRFNYWNIGGAGVTLSTKWRWVSDAQWLQMDLDIPRPMHLPLYAGLSFSQRDESWKLPSQGDGFRLQTKDAGMSVTIPLRLPALSVTLGAGGRRREFEPTTGVDAAASCTGTDSMNLDENTTGVLWLRAAPRVLFRERQLDRGWVFRPTVRGGADMGWARGQAVVPISRLSLSSDFRFNRAAAGSGRQSLSIALHGGRLSSPALAEDHFVLGTGPDADFPLRAHPYLRGGQPGTTPLAAEFVLGNLTAATDIKSWKWLTLGIVGLVDVGRASELYPGQCLPATMFDVGLGVELGSPLSSSRRFTFVWGRDVVERRSVFYVAASIR